MKLILKEDVDNLGAAGQIVTVRPGYARNFLLPRGLALRADEGNMSQLEQARVQIERHQKKIRAQGEFLKGQLEKIRVVINRRAGEDGKLFGSVTTADISDALEAKELTVDRRTILLAEPIKHLGDHTIEVKIKQVGSASLKVSVEPIEE